MQRKRLVLSMLLIQTVMPARHVPGIPSADLTKWKEDPNLRPQQFNSLDVHPGLKDLITQTAHEEPSRPVFSHDEQNYEEDDLQFVTKDGEGIDQVIKKPNIGLEWNVQYNDELPNQLTPDLYFKLNWALAEDRQELTREM